MDRVPGWFILGLMVCWLTVVGQYGFALSSDCHSVAAQTSAPADDNDDPSDDGTPADDFTIQTRRIEAAVPLQLVLRLKSFVPKRPVSRETTAFILPRIWQFLERAAATPRAPSFLA